MYGILLAASAAAAGLSVGAFELAHGIAAVSSGTDPWSALGAGGGALSFGSAVVVFLRYWAQGRIVVVDTAQSAERLAELTHASHSRESDLQRLLEDAHKREREARTREDAYLLALQKFPAADRRKEPRDE